MSAVSVKADIKLEYLEGVETVEELKSKGKAELMYNIRQDKIIKKLNQYFENQNEDVRIFGSRLLKKKYYLRKRASDRTYHYILPVSLFSRYKKEDETALIVKRDPKEVLQMLQEVMPTLEGSHPFHSYTSLKMLGDIKIKFDSEGKKPPKADQLQRVVLGFTVEECKHNSNWLQFKIHG